MGLNLLKKKCIVEEVQSLFCRDIFENRENAK